MLILANSIILLTRFELIEDNFYYQGPALPKDATVILIEDAVISGAHWVETQRILVKQGLPLSNIYCCCLAKLDSTHLQYTLEDQLNHSWVQKHHPQRLVDLWIDPVFPDVMSYFKAIFSVLLAFT